MTLGTGRLSKTQIRDTGLIARHDYSVLGVSEIVQLFCGQN